MENTSRTLSLHRLFPRSTASRPSPEDVSPEDVSPMSGAPSASPLVRPLPGCLSPRYWHTAAGEVRDLRKLTFAALMIAMCTVLGYLPAVRVLNAKVTWGFLARALCGLAGGPVLGAVFGFAEDILSFFLTGGGGEPFFPGYTLSTMLGVVIYALCLYRAPLDGWRLPVRVLAAKLLTNVENVLLGTLWLSITTGKGYLVLAPARALKNLVMLPVQAAVLTVLIAALLPALRKSGLVPKEETYWRKRD